MIARDGDPFKVANKVTIFLMTEKGYQFLLALMDKYRSIIELVVVGSDKNIRNDYEREIFELCNQKDVPCVKRGDIKKINTKYVLAISWRWLINHPMEHLVIFHDSLLPKYRGFSPLVNALINGENEVGVSAILGAADYDTGPILGQQNTKIDYPIKISRAIEMISSNYISLGDMILGSLLKGENLVGVPQNDCLATYSVWRDEVDYKIDWSSSADKIQRLVDSVGHPYKGAYTLFEGRVVRVFDVDIFPDLVIENRDIGKVLFNHEGFPIVICKKGLIKIKTAYYEENEVLTPFFPLKKFRVRFEI